MAGVGRLRAYLADAARSFERAPVEVAIALFIAVCFSIAIEVAGDAMRAFLEVAVSALLVLVQTVVLGQWCFLCLVTAVISLILVYWAYDEVWSSLVFLRSVWRRSRSARVVWTVFWGGYHEDAEAVAMGGR